MLGMSIDGGDKYSPSSSDSSPDSSSASPLTPLLNMANIFQLLGAGGPNNWTIDITASPILHDSP